MLEGAKKAFKRVELRFVAYLIIAILFLFYVLVLTGCLSTSPGVPDLFVLKLRNNGTEDVEVRIGYYGTCPVHSRKPLTKGGV
ncbi:hypothetical protein F5Y05DRAFT_364193 [Hypoxylon sp. FL0543]|nr:hypothetical protein F5Y05DRAFT_364193 [Hypoxylon sp. FL0543]